MNQTIATTMNVNQVRRAFLDFFISKQHQEIASSSLVPSNDPTLLFTNAGMVQFKDVFLGNDPRAYVRAVSSQRCVRAGGKHNDLENVGYTARHHTFFEMLGNFSFGDYFKRDAILYAWEFVTSKAWLGLSPERLLVTVYAEDDEAYQIWHTEVGLPPEKIIRIGDNKGARYQSDNFWAMGDTGPCGPCSEIFYDHDPDGSKGIWGGVPGSPEEDGDRWIEIWNIVFMQYERSADGVMTSLPKPSVDTGMGLERVAAVMQGVHANYEIDLFQNLLKNIVALGANNDSGLEGSRRVLADHIRAVSFLIADGVLPSNEGRGYVLRRILRRAVRHGNKLGLKPPFFHQLVAPLVAEMGDAYPDLRQKQHQIQAIILKEETQFAETLEHGMKLLNEALTKLDGTQVPGEVVFKLYDTYGFPVDLTADIVREQNLTLDLDGYERCMAVQRQRSQAGGKFKADYSAMARVDADSTFTGYESTQENEAQIIAILHNNVQVDTLNAGETGVIILDQTPFYAESGGQVGDSGYLINKNNINIFQVEDTQKQVAGQPGHVGVAAVDLAIGQTVRAEVNAERRTAIIRNHSATHLLHKILREQLGEHVQQKGSLVEADKLRFDFSHGEPLSLAQWHAIEAAVNAEILQNHARETCVTSFDDAVARGAMALFGEKYGDSVRMVAFGSASTELCGGVHVARTGDIGLFKLISEGGIAAGVRRVEALTGAAALQHIQSQEKQIHALASRLKTPKESLEARLEQLLTQQRAQEKQLENLQLQLARQQLMVSAQNAPKHLGYHIVVAELAGLDGKTLKDSALELKQQLGKAIVCLASVNEGKPSVLVAVSDGAPVKAGEVVQFIGAQIGAKGGGKPDFAQAGGGDAALLSVALASVVEWVCGR